MAKKAAVQADNDSPAAGHNEDERQARSARRSLFVERLLAIQAKMKPLLDERKKVRGEAKGEFKLSEIDAAMRLATMEDSQIFVDEIKELIAIAQAFNALPPGEQGSLFPDRRDGDERSFDDGKAAGINGKNPEPPMGFDPAKWMDGWHAGQEVRRAEMQADMERRNADAELIKGAASEDDPFEEPRVAAE